MNISGVRGGIKEITNLEDDMDQDYTIDELVAVDAQRGMSFG